MVPEPSYTRWRNRLNEGVGYVSSGAHWPALQGMTNISSSWPQSLRLLASYTHGWSTVTATSLGSVAPASIPTWNWKNAACRAQHREQSGRVEA